eukprot:365309-Chlamydomonas_euryale.AAC.7
MIGARKLGKKNAVPTAAGSNLKPATPVKSNRKKGLGTEKRCVCGQLSRKGFNDHRRGCSASQQEMSQKLKKCGSQTLYLGCHGFNAMLSCHEA